MEISTIADNPKAAISGLIGIGAFLIVFIYAWIQEGRGNGD